MASEVISLLHGLLSSSATDSAKIWASAVRDVLREVLDCVPQLLHTLETGNESVTIEEPVEDGQSSSEHAWFLKARDVVAALCALGGFHQNVHSGCAVEVSYSFVLC